MSNSYRYLDLDNSYIDSTTGILKNLQDITDPEVLIFVESSTVTKRLNELYETPIKIIGIESIFIIHQHLFQDIYVWAGQKRTVDISKDGKQFFPISNFDSALSYIDQLINEYNEIPKNDFANLSEKLAELLDSINYLHPFREGNGRAQREFLRLLAQEKGLTLNLNPPDSKSVYERYMKGTIESDIQTLTELIYALITQI